MVSHPLFLYLIGIFILAPTILADCPSIKPSNPIPGCWGEPGCAYVLVSDLGSGAACQFDYCDCGGINVPLLPTTTGGTTTVGCGAYTTVPTKDNCPTTSASLGGSSGSGGRNSTGGSPPSSLTTLGGPFPNSTTSKSVLSYPITTSGPLSGSIVSAESSLSVSITTNGPVANPTPTGGPPPTSITTTGPLPNSATTAKSLSSPSSNDGSFSASVTNGASLPTPITTGGPISTASDAFATTALSVTTLFYQGGALTYKRATFTSLSAQTSTGTITATITETASAGSAVATYVGPIIVGPQGIFWGPPGSAPNCVWPFCTKSGPPSGSNGVGGDASGGGGGGVGGSFGCQDCFGGGGTNGQGGGSEGGGGGGGGSGGGDGGGGSGGGGGGGGGEGGGNDGGSEGANGESPPEACPGSKRIKRSDSSASQSGRMVKRAEEQITSTNPLKDALNNFGTDKGGNGLASAALDTADGILTNIFPKDKANGYITGLTGKYKLTQKLTVGTGDNQNTFPSGTNLFWRVRWDYDQVKGPHVNAQFGSKSSTKFAYNLDPSQYTNEDPRKTMNGIARNLNKQCKYSINDNIGKSSPTWDTTEEQAIEDLKNYFKSVANGPC